MKKCFCAVLAVCICFIANPILSASSDQAASSASKKSWLNRLFRQPESGSRQPLEIDAPSILAASRLPSFKHGPDDFPYNVSVVGKEELGEKSPHTLQEAVKTLEGVTIFDQVGNAMDETLGLRGSTKGGEEIFVVDGVRVNEVDGLYHLLPLIRMDDIETIEIARGSSSAIYGGGAFGGVVNMTTRKPSEKPFSLFGGTDWSSFRGVHFYNGISGTLQDELTPMGGAWTYYFNMGRDQARGFRSNDEFRDTSFNFKTSYELPDNEGGIRFGLKNTVNALSNPGALTLSEYRDDFRQSKQLTDGRKMQSKTLYLNANKRLLDQKLNASLQGSIRRNTMRFYSSSRTFPEVFGVDLNPDVDLTTTRSHERNLIGQLTYQDELNWLKHESLLGAEITQGFLHDRKQDAPMGSIRESSPIETLRSAERTDFGVFAQERFTFFDKLTQEFGIRGSFDWLAFVDERNHANDFNRHWRDLSLNTGTLWSPVKWGQLFWNYSQAFRVPQFFEITNFSGDPSADLVPETAETFEVGTRLKFRDRVQAKFSYFELIKHNEIVYDASAVSQTNQLGRNANAGRVRRNGVEFRLDWKVLEELSVFGTYTLTRAIVRKGAGNEETPYAAFPNRALGQVPKHRGTVGLKAEPLKRFGSPYDGLRIFLSGVFTGRQPVQSFESMTQSMIDAMGGFIKPYQVWDLKVSYEWKKKEIFLKINNLFDERYYSRAVVATGWGTTTTPAGDYLFVNPAPPREFVLGLKYEF